MQVSQRQEPIHELRFGADGIREIAGEWPLVPQAVETLGHALSKFLVEQSEHPVAVIGRDTRPSGAILVSSMKAGLLHQGVDVIDLGIMTTPGVAYLTRRLGADLGVIISASHNPVQYNGIKLVGRRGLRLQREDEIEIESLVNMSPGGNIEPAAILGQQTNGEHLIELYIQDHIKRCPVESLVGLKIILDCANGAASRVAPEVFARLGAEVIAVNNESAGDRINDCCGSEHARRYPQDLIAVVRRHNAAYGFAFDGDGDRLVAVDSTGCMYNGDDFLFALATHYHSLGLLRGNTIVTTQMANAGLEEALSRMGIKIVYTKNGDKYLEAAMWSGDYVLGSEQVGNVIINDGHHTAADAVYAAMVISGMLCQRGKSLGEMVAPLQKRPQVSASVHLLATPPLEQMSAFSEQRQRSLAVLGDDCRILTWYSSTEPGLFRVMAEGSSRSTPDEVRQEAMCICQTVQQATRSEESEEVVMVELSARRRI